MTGSSTDGDSGRTTPLATVRPMGVMIRPGQQGALYFDKADVTDFLRRWNIECEDYGLNDNQKCARIIDYCSKETQEIIEVLEGYTTSSWDKLQTELKELFWQYDKQRDSTISLNQLIKDAPNLDLNIFVVRYSAISEKLFKAGALSSLDRIIRLINGLPKTLRDQSIDFCTKENWKLSSNDTGKNAPDFSKLKTFILTKAQSAQKRAVLDQERDITESLDTHSLTTNTVSNLIPTGTNPSPKTPATKDSMEDIIQGIARLTLAIEANTNNLNQRINSLNTSASLEMAVNNTPLSSIPSNPPSFSLRTNERIARCIWCDSTDHSRRDLCSDFLEKLKNGHIRMNENGRIAITASGEEIPTMFGRGGMKKLFDLQHRSTIVSNRNVTAEMCGSIGNGNSVRLTIFDRYGNVTHEIIDADVNEKRKRDGLESLRRKVRPRTAESSPATEMNIEPFPINESSDIIENPSSGMDSGESSTTSTKKYRLSSKLQESIDMDELGNKIMETNVNLSLHELFAISPDISDWLNDRTKRTRHPISQAPMSANVNNISDIVNTSANLVTSKPLYACPSGRANVNLENGKASVSALLDNGSEIVMMPKRTFNTLDLPIDTEINWRINGYQGSGKIGSSGTEYSGPLGVCHDVLISVGGVDAHMPVFIVEHCDQDLLLGRPWERYVRAEFKNEDNGDYICTIKSPDGRRQARFVAVRGDHERNRQFAKEPEEGYVGAEWGKA